MARRPSPIAELKAALDNYPELTAPLTKSEAAVLSRRVRKGDLAARERMTLSCAYLVLNIAHKLRLGNLPLEDRVSEGLAGAMRAAEKFDPKHNCNFSTYATYWIRQHIQRAAELHWLIGIPSHMHDRLRAYEKHSQELAVKGPLPDGDAICEGIGFTNGSAKAIQRLIQTSKIAWLIKRGEYGHPDNQENPAFGIIGPEESTGELVAEADHRRHNIARVRRAMGRLNPRHREILKRRMNGETFQSIADELGISRERIRQIEWLSIRRVSKSLKAGGESAMTLSQAMKETEI